MNKITLGNATLYLGDCRDIMPTIDSDVVISDPPYGINYSYEGEYQDKGGEDYINLIQVFKGRKSVLLHYPEETMQYFMPLMGVPDKCLAWCYNSNTPRAFRLWSFFGIKPDFSAYKQPPKNIGDSRVASLVRSYDWFDDIQQVKNVSEEKTDHPCQIPVKVMERVVALTKAETILDPFMGSGSTGVAAINLGKKFIGIEREQKYFDISCERIQTAVQQERLFA